MYLWCILLYVRNIGFILGRCIDCNIVYMGHFRSVTYMAYSLISYYVKIY